MAAAPPQRRRRTERRRVRRPPDVAKAQLLAAGVDLVHERAMGETLGHLRISDLARRAGVTSGAFYHHWPDGQEAYRADLLDALLTGDRVDTDLLTGAVEGLEGLRQATTRVATRLRRLERAPPGAGPLGPRRPPRQRRPPPTRRRRTDAAWTAGLARFLTACGRAPGPGWDLSTLATSLVLLNDGLRTQELMDATRLPEVVDLSGRTWPLGGLLAVVVLLGATEPGEVEVPSSEAAEDSDPGAEVTPKRRRLLDLGVAAALAQPTGNALDHIRADDVVARVGVTVGAFYHYWETQDDYRDDLVDTLFDADRYLDPEDVEAQADTTLSATDIDEGARRATSWYWSEAAEHPANTVQLGFAALGDPYIDARLGDETRALQGPWTQVLEGLLDQFDRHLRPPLIAEQVVLGMGAAMDGCVVRHRLDPTGLGPDAEGWTRWGRACAAMVRGATAPAGDDRDLYNVAEDAFGT